MLPHLIMIIQWQAISSHMSYLLKQSVYIDACLAVFYKQSRGSGGEVRYHCFSFEFIGIYLPF